MSKYPGLRLTTRPDADLLQAISTSFVLLLVCLALPANAAPKTDVVIFKNGDRLTGEVKSLERGRLRFNTDATGTINIEWDDIASVASNQNIQVETQSGVRHLGRLLSEAESEKLSVATRHGVTQLAVPDVVLMTPIEERGVNRIDGDITAGFGFTKASEVTQFRFGLDLDYRTEVRILSLDASTVTTDTEDANTSQRQTLNLNYQRLWPDRWLTGGVLRLEQNDELGIDLRSSIGAGGGRILRQSNSSSVALEGGLLFSNEKFDGEQKDNQSLEAFATLTWDWFRYDAPELDLSTTFQVIPNLSDSGRVRGELDIEFKWEIVEDLFWELALYDSYDSDPVLQDAEKNDYGVTTSLGWSL